MTNKLLSFHNYPPAIIPSLPTRPAAARPGCQNLTQAGKLEQAGLEAGIGRSWEAGIPRPWVPCTLGRTPSSKLEEAGPPHNYYGIISIFKLFLNKIFILIIII